MQDKSSSACDVKLGFEIHVKQCSMHKTDKSVGISDNLMFHDINILERRSL